VISNEQNGNSRFGTSRACAYLGSSFSFSPSAYFINLGISSLAQSNPFYFSRVSFTRLWRSNGFPFLSHCKHSTFERTNLALSFGLSFPYRSIMFRFHTRSPLVQAQITRALYYRFGKTAFMQWRQVHFWGKAASKEKVSRTWEKKE